MSPQEGEQQASSVEGELRRVFGERGEDVVRKGREEGAGQEAVRARARRVETVPSEKEVEERDLDHVVLRSWRPRV